MHTTEVCTYKLMKNEFAKSMNSSYKTISYLFFLFFGGGGTNKLMFTFYLYLAFIQTRNVRSLSNKHLRHALLILISLTSNYRLTYTTGKTKTIIINTPCKYINANSSCYSKSIPRFIRHTCCNLNIATRGTLITVNSYLYGKLFCNSNWREFAQHAIFSYYRVY